MRKQPTSTPRKLRADARKNEDAVLEAAKQLFASLGVDAPAREIAVRAGVGVATLYRRFPKRSDLIAAVFRREVDKCVAEAEVLARSFAPAVALRKWLLSYMHFIATKRGLAAALHSGDPAYASLPGYFQRNFEPVLEELLHSARSDVKQRADVTAYDLLRAIGNLSIAQGKDAQGHIERMVALLIDGLMRP